MPLRPGQSHQRSSDLRAGSCLGSLAGSGGYVGGRLPSPEKLLNLRVLTFGEEPLGVAQGNLRFGFRIEKYAVVANRKNARQLVGDHDDRGAEAVAQLEDQIVQQPRADGVETGRRLVEQQYLR